MEDSVWSQIMKIQPIVEHEPPHKGVEGEAQASEEVRNKHNTLIGLRHRDDLPRSRKPVLDIGGQVSDLPKLRDVLPLESRRPPTGLEGQIRTYWRIWGVGAWVLGVRTRGARRSKGGGKEA